MIVKMRVEVKVTAQDGPCAGVYMVREREILVEGHDSNPASVLSRLAFHDAIVALEDHAAGQLRLPLPRTA